MTTRAELQGKTLDDLRTIATSVGVEADGLQKAKLIAAILQSGGVEVKAPDPVELPAAEKMTSTSTATRTRPRTGNGTKSSDEHRTRDGNGSRKRKRSLRHGTMVSKSDMSRVRLPPGSRAFLSSARPNPQRAHIFASITGQGSMALSMPAAFISRTLRRTSRCETSGHFSSAQSRMISWSSGSRTASSWCNE